MSTSLGRKLTEKHWDCNLSSEAKDHKNNKTSKLKETLRPAQMFCSDHISDTVQIVMLGKLLQSL